MIDTKVQQHLEIEGPVRLRLDFQTSDGKHNHSDLTGIAGLFIMFGEYGPQPEGDSAHPGFAYLIGCPHNALAVAIVAIRLLRMAGYMVPAQLHELLGVAPPRCPSDGTDPRCAAPTKPD